VRDSAREAELIERSRTLIESKEIESYYVRFLRSTIDLSCKYQSKLLGGMKVAYCGDEGAFAYIAALRMFPDSQLISYPDFTEPLRTANATARCSRLRTATRARSAR